MIPSVTLYTLRAHFGLTDALLRLEVVLQGMVVFMDTEHLFCFCIKRQLYLSHTE